MSEIYPKGEETMSQGKPRKAFLEKEREKSNRKLSEFGWGDYCCEGCGIYKMLKKRESDGKLLCKKCSKNKSLPMAIKEKKK